MNSLLVPGIDLKNNLDKRPVSRQMLYSLKAYANSDQFSPSTEVSIEMIDQIFKKNN